MSAPVNLITGLPGNGKTLYTLTKVKALAEAENRAVYYAGIEVLDPVALPWHRIDPLEWHKCPPGSIIVLDEAHKVFPLRPVGSHVPAHVLPIAELRHEGHTLFLITQHPMEIDSAVRRRVGRHLHLVRRFGSASVAVREWSRCVENCDKTSKDSQSSEWLLNKAAYGWYKSAELHTIKRRLPPRLLWLLVAVLVIPFAIWYMLRFVHQREAHPLGSLSPPSASASPGSSVARPGPLTPAQYVAQFEPRIAGLAYTAPVYDEVTKPVHAPYPAACVQSATRCQCYTQQGTRLQVPADLCKGIAQGGFFMAWDEKTGREEPRALPAPVSRSEPLAGGSFSFDAGRRGGPSESPAAAAAAADTGSALARARGIGGARPVNAGGGNG